MRDYDRLERDVRQPRRVVDHSDRWNSLEPVESTSGVTRDRIVAFCEPKHITIEALAFFTTRVRIDKNGGVELAWGYQHR